MTKKIKKHDDLTITIDKKIQDALGIGKNSDLEMIVIDDMLIVKSKNKDSHVVEKRNKKLEASTNEIMDKYASVLKKLAKT
jgi:bifunctional DNA-binding transcriptional regulator/antitoxin component of YhaV-PrlF toxin-antitoxin module